jgi:hypothetical protein
MTGTETLVRTAGRPVRCVVAGGTTASLTRTAAPGFMKLADGQVIDGTAFYDSISFNDLWARVQPA